jgi:hypothetical protein
MGTGPVQARLNDPELFNPLFGNAYRLGKNSQLDYFKRYLNDVLFLVNGVLS